MQELLASALPGLRDLRAPLIAGYLWLLFAWIVSAGHVDSGDAVIGDILDASSAAGDFATLVALSVAAYLVGAISQPVSDAARSAVLWVWNADPYNDYGMSAGPPQRMQRLGWMLVGPVVVVWRRLKRFFGVGQATEPPEDDPASWIQEAIPSLGARAEDAEILRPALERARALAELVDEGGAALPLAAQQIGVRLEPRVRALGRELSRELDLPATLLVGDQPMLFSEVDRLRAEADIRTTVAPPLVAIAFAASAQSSAWWLLLALGAFVLLVLGAQRYEQSRKAIRDAMTFGKVESAAVKRFDAWLDEEVKRLPASA